MKRRTLLTGAVPIAWAAGHAWAQSTADTRPVRLLVPFAAGGATDITARAIAGPLSQRLQRPITVENRPGAGGATCMAEVAAAAPDGLTLGIATLSTHGVNPAVYRHLPYNIDAFTPITEIVKAPGVLVVHPDLPARDFAQFIRYVKAQPGKVAYASPGNGTIGHMWGELLKSTTNTFMTHVPYRGAAPALADVVSGKVPVYFDQVASSLPHIQAGRLRALAVSWKERLAVLPTVPTYAELSLFSSNDPSWFGLVGPAGMPAAMARQWRDAVATVLQEPSVKTQLADQGLFGSGSLPDEFSAQIRKEVDKMRRVSRFARIVLD
ncbi:tripartite tricarboxylate transporter substrate binding protein BugE [Acidovorax sp. A1169]|uniref:tripartite tricarboxylate transporter substrate binding protein BugE n=1 Tax=Acidovorax sp. A1169 TaxID=3059524 RepID=UPI002737E02B|nr:tripartite tricarboxylate transporter substrate binding protein BugE [Acidovorax sp. A1169]MDP4075667.1 tripartite tricarboxylate transporter substrate binding protein BugE [Acidovorax sp. A1169]